MIKQSTFNEGVQEFDRRERRTDFFALASNLISKGFDIEAHILLLATWNFARFRYAVKEFDIEKFRKTLRNLDKNFNALKNQTLGSIDLNKHQSDITTIFEALSAIKGIEFTGAPKLMHLVNPRLFVMWDNYIRGAKSKQFYSDLPIINSGEWIFENYPSNAEGYIRFLKDMQCRFRHLSPPSSSKTLAKAIDEFNYVHITLAIQEMEKRRKNLSNHGSEA